MKDYLDDLLVVGIIVAILLPILITLLKKDWIFILKLLGVLLVLAAVPVTIMSGLSVNGCCGAPSRGYNGIEYLIGGSMLATGIAAIIFSNKLSKNKKT